MNTHTHTQLERAIKKHKRGSHTHTYLVYISLLEQGLCAVGELLQLGKLATIGLHEVVELTLLQMGKKVRRVTGKKNARGERRESEKAKGFNQKSVSVRKARGREGGSFVRRSRRLRSRRGP